MATIRKLAFDLADRFYDEHFREPEPTDAEVADLLARVLEAAGHEVRELISPEDVNLSASVFRKAVLLRVDVESVPAAVVQHLAYWRAALARDDEKAEQEQAVEGRLEKVKGAFERRMLRTASLAEVGAMRIAIQEVLKESA